MKHLALMLSLVCVLLLSLLPVARAMAGGDAGAARAGTTSRLLKDGQDDKSDDGSSGGSGGGSDASSDTSGSNDSGSSDDSSSGDSSSDDSGDSGSDDNSSDNGGSDDGSSDTSGDASDDSGGDDGSSGGTDDNGGDGSDDAADDSHGGNDDFALDAPVASPDGLTSPVVDDDGNDATDGFRSGQAIVRLQPDAEIEEYNQRHGTTLVAAIGSHDLYLLQLPAGKAEGEIERELANDPDTRWSELNYVNQAPEGRPGYFFVSGAPAPASAEEYAPALLGYPTAQTCSTGADVIVAVLDTGIDAAHPALAGHVLDNGWNALNNSTEVADAGNGIDDDNDGLVDEMVGHGTHVAGIIAQVAPDAKILPVKVLSSDGVGDAFFVAAGIYYAVDHGARVINLSLSSTYDARVIADAVAEASEAGVVVVAAAGNNATDRVLEFPAADTGVIGVASTNQDDVKSDFSNYGDRIDIAAPGEGIVSSLPDGRYAAWSGTSMSAPFVAGAAALIAGAHPSWASPQITKRLLKTADAIDKENPGYAGELGAGRLDVAAAVACKPAESAANGTKSS